MKQESPQLKETNHKPLKAIRLIILRRCYAEDEIRVIPKGSSGKDSPSIAFPRTENDQRLAASSVNKSFYAASVFSVQRV